MLKVQQHAGPFGGGASTPPNGAFLSGDERAAETITNRTLSNAEAAVPSANCLLTCEFKEIKDENMKSFHTWGDTEPEVLLSASCREAVGRHGGRGRDHSPRADKRRCSELDDISPKCPGVSVRESEQGSDGPTNDVSAGLTFREITNCDSSKDINGSGKIAAKYNYPTVKLQRTWF